MKEFETDNGTTLYYKVYYDLGGFNYFTYTTRQRGYYISIQRRYNGFAAFSDLSSPDGAIKYLLLECNRKSAKRAQEAEDMALGTIKDIVAVYNDRGIKL